MHIVFLTVLAIACAYVCMYMCMCACSFKLMHATTWCCFRRKLLLKVFIQSLLPPVARVLFNWFRAQLHTCMYVCRCVHVHMHCSHLLHVCINSDGCSCISTQISYQYEKPSNCVFLFCFCYFCVTFISTSLLAMKLANYLPSSANYLRTQMQYICQDVHVCVYIECLLNFSYPRQLSVLPSFNFTFQMLPESSFVCFAHSLPNVCIKWIY